MTGDTIFALASAPGRSGVAVMRISGGMAGAILTALAGDPGKPRTARLTALRRQGAVLDHALTLWFPAPHSFTGEDVAELHLHGGPAIIAAVGEALTALGARPADPGEFTRRAFEAGKLDLTEAEGLADLIDAETEAQRVQAVRQMSGELRAVYESWRGEILAASALVEADIDFPDEGDVGEGQASRAVAPIQRLITDLERHLADGARGERLRRGLQIAIIGAPNAGKSSLLNRLARRDAAIVTDIPGTTRDVLEVHLDLDGYPVTLADTAGLRETDDRVEAEGVRRAVRRAEEADLRVGVLDASDPGSWDQTLGRLVDGDMVVFNKTDLANPETAPDGALAVSAETGDGLGALEARLSMIARDRLALTEQAGLTRARHRQGVERARDALRRALAGLDEPELAGEDLRLARRALESLTGRVDVEDILGEIFSRFCVGK